MKSLIFASALLLAVTAQTAPQVDSPIDSKTLEALRQNVCSEVVDYAKSEGLKKYKMRHCLKNLEVSYIDEKYNVDSNAPVKYEIHFQDDYAKELMDTEQWIMCEIFITEPINPDNYEFFYCSIEG